MSMGSDVCRSLSLQQNAITKRKGLLWVVGLDDLVHGQVASAVRSLGSTKGSNCWPGPGSKGGQARVSQSLLRDILNDLKSSCQAPPPNSPTPGSRPLKMAVGLTQRERKWRSVPEVRRVRR
jgi:hypothetical protein